MKKGITLLPVVAGIVLSLVAIIVVLSIAVSRAHEVKKDNRRIAAQMSDLGFQKIGEIASDVSSLVDLDPNTLDTIVTDNGWYKLDVKKNLQNDTMNITISSVGGAGKEIIEQIKNFQLLKVESDTGSAWNAIVY